MVSDVQNVSYIDVLCMFVIAYVVSLWSNNQFGILVLWNTTSLAPMMQAWFTYIFMYYILGPCKKNVYYNITAL